MNAPKQESKSTHQTSSGRLLVVAAQERDWVKLAEEELSRRLCPLIVSEFMEKTLSERTYPVIHAIKAKLQSKHKCFVRN